MKTCKGCKEDKPIKEFFRHPTTKDKRQTYCKDCQQSRIQSWREGNREKHNTYRREYAQKARAEVKNLGGNICWCCGSTEDIQLDHIEPKLWSSAKETSTHQDYYDIRRDPSLMGTKFQLLCRDCNGWKAHGPACPCHWWDENFPGWRENAEVDK